jgi:uncharacterized membrane protein YgaE (UPF0421/DUF939 family)
MVLIDLASNLQSILVLVGAFAGNFVATMIPYWRVQSEFKELGLGIVFDPKFLGTAAVSAITSFVIVSGAFSAIYVQVDSNATIIVTFLTAAIIGYGLNSGLNTLMPSVNKEQKEQVMQIQEKSIIENYENKQKLQSVLEAEAKQNTGTQA